MPDVDGFWQGFEPPVCPDCMDEAMDETEHGFRCRFCGFRTEWDEEAGVWVDYPPEDTNA